MANNFIPFGSRGIPIPPVDGQKVFNQLQQSGKIPQTAAYGGYNEDTKEVSYRIPLTGEQAFQE